MSGAELGARRSAHVLVFVWLLTIFGCQQPSVDAAAGSESGVTPRASASVEVFVLGIAQDGGLPHLGCRRACCREARASGRVEYPVSLGVVDRRNDQVLLVEATPKIEEQIGLLDEWSGLDRTGRAPVDAVVLTHAHIGHYLGLALFGREVLGARDLPVHCSTRFAEFLRSGGPWSQLVELGQIDITSFEPGESFEPWGGLSVRSIPVPHRDEFSDTMAFVIEGPIRSLLFVPDIDAWEKSPGLLDRLLDGVDIALVDGTFYDGSELPHRDPSEVPHPLMLRTMDLLQERVAERPGSVQFLHLNHTNQVLHDEELRAEVRARGFDVVQAGDRFIL
ncbi:MAG: MBL fold metallo-hydrolase [Planctomycetota bacterium]